ncbi:MAG: tetratricopeptide repeat protein [Methanomicrobiales archaeon]
MSWDYQGLGYIGSQKYDTAFSSFNRATGFTVTNAAIWNYTGLAYIQLGKPQDAAECFKKAISIDPNFADAKVNRDNKVSKLQIVSITGMITPEVTTSRIGTFYTTATPAPQNTEVTTVPQVARKVTTIATLATAPIHSKTTYSPLSPLTALGALLGMSGIILASNRRKNNFFRSSF